MFPIDILRYILYVVEQIFTINCGFITNTTLRSIMLLNHVVYIYQSNFN